MIVKSLPRKTRSFGQLLRYINASAETGRALLHNLRSTPDDLAAIEAELLDNSRLLSPRKNGNYLYHEILSFGVGDRELVTAAMLEDVARAYLELRAPYALAYARAHWETSNSHIHLLISANNVGSSKRLRLSRQEFQQIKRQLERHQRERYPQLEHSVVFDRPKRRHRPARQQGRKESERERRLQKSGSRSLSRKEELQSLLQTEMATAISGEDFYRRLQAQGLRLYRRGRSVAVEDTSKGRKYRLRTLGLAETFDQAMVQWRGMTRRLQTIHEVESCRDERQLNRRRLPQRGPPDTDRSR